MRGIGPNKRPTALIFQNLALFPLMSVADNIAFGLEVRGIRRAERRKRADAPLDLIALEGQGEKKVGELSGGQKQRSEEHPSELQSLMRISYAVFCMTKNTKIHKKPRQS